MENTKIETEHYTSKAINLASKNYEELPHTDPWCQCNAVAYNTEKKTYWFTSLKTWESNKQLIHSLN